MSSSLHRLAALGGRPIIGSAGLAACGANDAQERRRRRQRGGKTIALLLPESETTRYEAFDRPLFEEKVKELCPDCTVNYYNADQDEAKQAQQMETAISEGARVIVLDPVNGAGAGGMVQSAQEAAPRSSPTTGSSPSADYYMSFDNATVGKLQAAGAGRGDGRQGRHHHAQRRPEGPERRAVQEGRAQRPRRLAA